MLKEFKFNVYIRYYMLCFFDLTFFSIMKIIDASEGNDKEENGGSAERRMATLVSYVLFTLSLVVPVFLVTVVCVRQPVMRIKGAKSQFNTLVLKVDKGSRTRLFTTFYFFFRRILTALLLSIPSENTFIFMQYVFILMSSHSYVLYLVSMKPYQTQLFNNYVLANETFYSALIIAIFIFSDATPELSIKLGAAIVLIVSVNLMIFSNFLMVMIMTYKGRDRVKDEIKRAKLRRAEKELMEEEEEEERKQRASRDAEDFAKLPDDVEDMADLEDAAADQLNEIDQVEEKKFMKKKRRDGKKTKGADDDQLVSYGGDDSKGGIYDTTQGNTTQGLMVNDSKDGLTVDDVGTKKRKKKAKRRAIDKKTKVVDADNDQLHTGAFMGEIAEKLGKDSSDKNKKSSTETASDSDKKRKKKRQKAKKEAEMATPTRGDDGGDGQDDQDTNGKFLGE